jgi:hypothetical protein
MKQWIKYALGFLAVSLLIAFFGREGMTVMYPASEEPKKPEKVLPPFGNILFTEGGDDVSPAPAGNSKACQKSSSNRTASFPIGRE